MDASDITELTKNPNITNEGLTYEEDGETKLLPRCDEQDKDGYTFTEDELIKKQEWQQHFAIKYPDMDKTMIAWIIDWYIKHPDEAQANMEKDKKFMRQLKKD
jgi:hypothetical protein